MSSIAPIQLWKLPRVPDDRGDLSFLQECDQVPFAIRRVYWIYDVPGGQERGSHAFRKTDEIIVALSGSFDVHLTTTSGESVYSLNRSYNALFVPRLVWRTLKNFSTNSLALVLASTEFDVSDYIRDFDEFRHVAANAARE
jgi:hypothetical protein